MPKSCILVQQILANQTIQKLDNASNMGLQLNYEQRQCDLCSKWTEFQRAMKMSNENFQDIINVMYFVQAHLGNEFKICQGKMFRDTLVTYAHL